MRRALPTCSLPLLLVACGGSPAPEAARPAPATPAPAKSAPVAPPAPTVGGGALDAPAVGPAPAFGLGGEGLVLVKNWDFGTDAGSTITDQATMNVHFQYHDQFGTVANGTNYGAPIVAPSADLALTHSSIPQPVEGRDTGGKPVRAFTAEGLKTFLVPLRGAAECHPERHDVGCGSFQAIWKLPKGGSRLGQDVVWETRVRMVTPPYFWFAIWTCGNKWNRGAEIDVVESFGYDNGGGYTNYDGRYWHVGIVGGRKDIEYKNWGATMRQVGFPSFDATQWHVWTMVYRADDRIEVFLDGKTVQTGFSHWTLKTEPDGEALDMSFIFDGGWGHTKVASVNKPLKAEAFADSFYEWDYSRVYLRAAPFAP